jgi:hypothetical protein
MKGLIYRSTLFAGKIDRRHIQQMLTIMSLFVVIGASAPGGGLENPGNGR